VGKECLPGAHFGFTCALHNDVEELREGREEREDAGEECLVWWRWGVYLIIEDIVEEDFEGVREVVEVLVVVR
jgi:hypothetical protein